MKLKISILLLFLMSNVENKCSEFDNVIGNFKEISTKNIATTNNKIINNVLNNRFIGLSDLIKFTGVNIKTLRNNMRVYLESVRNIK